MVDVKGKWVRCLGGGIQTYVVEAEIDAPEHEEEALKRVLVSGR